MFCTGGLEGISIAQDFLSPSLATQLILIQSLDPALPGLWTD